MSVLIKINKALNKGACVLLSRWVLLRPVCRLPKLFQKVIYLLKALSQLFHHASKKFSIILKALHVVIIALSFGIGPGLRACL